MSFLHLSCGILKNSSFANCSKSFRFERFLLPTAVLRSLHRFSMGFRSGLIAGHLRTLQCFVCNHFCVLGHCPAGRPMTSGGDAAFWHWPLRCAPKFFGNHQISWYHSYSQEVAKQPQNIFEPPPCLTVGTVFYFEGFISFSVKSAMSPLPKNSTFVSSVHSTFSQKDCGFVTLVLANSSLAFLCLCVSSGVLLGLPFYSDDSAS